MSRNSRESSWSLLLLAVCSVRRGWRREWRELRMTWYRLWTCFAVFLASTSCYSYPRSPSARHACSCRRAIAFRSMICMPLSDPVEDLPIDLASDRSLRREERSMPRDSRCLLWEPERWLSLRQLVDWPRKEEKLSSRPVIDRLPLRKEPYLLPSTVYYCLLAVFYWRGVAEGAVHCWILTCCAWGRAGWGRRKEERARRRAQARRRRPRSSLQERESTRKRATEAAADRSSMRQWSHCDTIAKECVFPATIIYYTPQQITICSQYMRCARKKHVKTHQDPIYFCIFTYFLILSCFLRLPSRFGLTLDYFYDFIWLSASAFL